MKRSKRQTKSSIERLKKLHHCRECSIKITRMDFKKILGKFTRVKLQYENSPKPKGKSTTGMQSPTTTSRLKSNQNGMVLIHRNAYSQHPVKDAMSLKNKPTRRNNKGTTSPRLLSQTPKDEKPSKVSTRIKNNIKNATMKVGKDMIPLKYREPLGTNNSKNSKDYSKNKLADLMVHVDEGVLPNENWCMDIFPKNENPKDDIVYDKIAAELENLMYNDIAKSSKKTQSKDDDFPSILDILNDNVSNSNSRVETINNCSDLSSNFAANDIEAMLLDESKPDSTKTDVAVSNVNNKIADSQAKDTIEEPGSPSILHEGKKVNVEEKPVENENSGLKKISPQNELKKRDEPLNNDCIESKTLIRLKTKPLDVTHVVFRRMHAGECLSSVKLFKTLSYLIELESKPIELLGSPKFVSSKDDIKMLLNIVNECKRESSFVWDKSLQL